MPGPPLCPPRARCDPLLPAPRRACSLLARSPRELPYPHPPPPPPPPGRGPGESSPRALRPSSGPPAPRAPRGQGGSPRARRGTLGLGSDREGEEGDLGEPSPSPRGRVFPRQKPHRPPPAPPRLPVHVGNPRWREAGDFQRASDPGREGGGEAFASAGAGARWGLPGFGLVPGRGGAGEGGRDRGRGQWAGPRAPRARAIGPPRARAGSGPRPRPTWRSARGLLLPRRRAGRKYVGPARAPDPACGGSGDRSGGGGNKKAFRCRCCPWRAQHPDSTRYRVIPGRRRHVRS